MACEYTINQYISIQPDYSAKIAAIDALIDKFILSLAMQESGTATGISEYQLDDGQIKIRTGYISMTQVSNGLRLLETLRTMYVNRMQGYSYVLRDVKSFRRR